MNSYYTIEKSAIAEYKDRGSRFLAFAFPIQTPEEFKKHLKVLKELHPKAVHYCFAYRLGIEGTSFRSGDNGEPAGSAGKPILGQIDSKSITNIAVIVVRYFGGTLLGIPGLIKAYKTVTSLCLQLTPIIEKPVLIYYTIEFDYTLMNEVVTIIKRYDCEVISNDIQLFCRMEVGMSKTSEKTCIEKLRELYGVQLKKT